MKFLSVICLISLAIAGMAEESNLERVFHESSNKFTARMFNEVANAKKSKSFVISAFSAMPPLGQLAFASARESQYELLNNLGMSDDNEMTAVFTHINSWLKSMKSITLSMASKIYIATSLELNKSFATFSKSIFSSEVENIDFGNSEEAAHQINQWVEENTNQKIKNLVQPDTISRDTVAVLANAVYFKGTWKYQFPEYKTQERDFHVNINETRQIQMMHNKQKYNYVESYDLNAQVLKLPYNGDEMSLVIVLPREIDGLHALEEKLKDPSALDKALNNLSEVKLDVYLPKFKIETEINLKEVLQKMGINKLFDPINAKLSKLLKHSSDLYINTATQKAFIEVNEEGTEAAAANAFLVYHSEDFRPIEKLEVVADHPFAFYLCKGRDILFSGVYYD